MAMRKDFHEPRKFSWNINGFSKAMQLGNCNIHGPMGLSWVFHGIFTQLQLVLIVDEILGVVSYSNLAYYDKNGLKL